VFVQNLSQIEQSAAELLTI